MNAANKKTDQSLLDFKTGISAAVHATTVIDQLMSYMWNAIMDSFTSFQDSDRIVIPILETHDLQSNIHDLLDKAVSNWVGNTVHILAFLHNLLPDNVMKAGSCNSL